MREGGGEHTHEGDLVRETQPVVGTPPQGDLSSVGLEEGGIADQAGRLAILECARTHDIRIDDFIEATASGQALREAQAARRADERPRARRPLGRQRALAARPVAGSDRDHPRRPRQGRRGLRGAQGENIRVEGKRDIQTKVMTTLLALFAEVERDLIKPYGD